MRRIRFSIANLLGLVLFVAIAFAALREADEFWESGLFTLSVCVLLTSVLLAIHRTDRKRSYWLGFALVGGSYLVASLVPPVESRLLTTKGLHFLDAKMPGREITPMWIVTAFDVDGSSTTSVQTVTASTNSQTLALPGQGTGGTRVQLWNASTGKMLTGTNRASENFVRIGHSLLALILAFGGGHLSRWLLEKERRPRTSEPGVTPIPAPDAPAD
jgi:hypothetical protein